MPKIMNDIQNMVRNMLYGFYFEHRDRLSYNSKHNIIYRKDLANIQQEIVLISGGGAVMNRLISAM